MNSVNCLVFRVLLNHVNIFNGTTTLHTHTYYILIKLMNLNLYTCMQISRIDNEINSDSSQLVFSQGIVDFITPCLVLSFANPACEDQRVNYKIHFHPISYMRLALQGCSLYYLIQ